MSGDKPAAGQGFFSLLGLLMQYVKPYWARVVFLLGLNILIAAVASLRPLLVAPVLNVLAKSTIAPAESLRTITLNNLGPTLLQAAGLENTSPARVILLVMSLYLAVSVLQAVLDMGCFILMVRTRTSILRDLMMGALRKLLSLPLLYFLRRQSGDLISRLTNDVTQTANSLDTLVRGLLQSACQIAFYGFVLVRTDAVLAGAIVGLSSLYFLLNHFLWKHVRVRTRESFEKAGLMSHRLMEVLQGIRVVKSFAAERYTDRMLGATADMLRHYIIRARLITFFDQPVRTVVNALVVCLAVLLSYRAMSAGRLSVEGFGMFLYLCMQVITPLGEFSRRLLELQGMLGGASRLQEVFLEKNELADGAQPVAPLERGILLRDVSFSYPDGNFRLQHLDLELKRGEMVAIVGPSGSGKSTLADLVLRLYDVQEGAILYDGTDIREFRQRLYRRQFGVVAQDCLLFNGTLKDNIVYGRAFDAEALERAITIANAKRFVDALPAGLDTEVGDRGVRLSGGERQRIAIARAVYEKPSLLILDEATSALDSESEHAVQQAIDAVTRDVTTLVIAHRLSTIQHAHKVVVLTGGRVEAVGRHEELLQTSPTYQRLCALQFRLRDAAESDV